MNLLVDLGNTRLKWALSSNDQWQHSGDLMPNDNMVSLLDNAWSALKPPTKSVIASVTGTESLQEVKRWMAAHWSLKPYVLMAGKEMLGVRNHYRQPEKLGSDRWAALIAAHHVLSAHVAVVDCGTAVTVDALSANGDYLGGMIFPGIRLLRESLVTGTQGINVTVGSDKTCLAHSTADGIAAGTLYGLSGAIERVLREFKTQLGAPMQVLVTGGDARLIIPHLDYPVTEIPDLVLQGLALIAEKLP